MALPDRFGDCVTGDGGVCLIAATGTWLSRRRSRGLTRADVIVGIRNVERSGGQPDQIGPFKQAAMLMISSAPSRPVNRR